jgi:predicted membrane metal-binding protein
MSRTLRIEPSPDDLGRRLEQLRRGAAEALAGVLPEPEAGLAAGILIGLRDHVDRDLAAAFTTAGVSHVVASRVGTSRSRGRHRGADRASGAGVGRS